MSRIDRHTLLYAFAVASVTSILPAHAGTAAKVAACLSSKIVQCPAALRTVPTMFCAGFHPFSHATPVLFWTFSKADAGAGPIEVLHPRGVAPEAPDFRLFDLKKFDLKKKRKS
jgi:hypothetical protein